MYQRAHPCEVPDVARDDESDGQDVMGEHLPVVRPPFLAVNHEDLMTPPSELSQVVELGECGKMDGRVSPPELLRGGGIGYPEQYHLFHFSMTG